MRLRTGFTAELPRPEPLPNCAHRAAKCFGGFARSQAVDALRHEKNIRYICADLACTLDYLRYFGAMTTTSLLRLADAISKRNADLLSGEECANTIRAVEDAAVANGARYLTGATWIGHAICGAAVATSKGALRLWKSGDAGPVLVVDGVTASLIAVRRVQSHLNIMGVAASVHIAAVVSEDASSDVVSVRSSHCFRGTAAETPSLATVA